MLRSASAAPAAAALPLFLPQAPPDKVSGLLHAATLLAQLLGQGRALDSRALRSAMEAAFGGTEEGAEKSHRAELYGEAETHAIPPAATDHRQVGVIEMEIAIKLFQGRGAVEAAVSPLLLDR